jgi:hypothetical protein
MKRIDTYSNFLQRKVNYLDSIKSIKDFKTQDIDKIIEYFGMEGFNDFEDCEEYLIDKVKEYQSLNDKVVLYRVIGSKSVNDINVKELGHHFTLYDWIFDGDFLLSIGYENWDDELEPYLIKIETDTLNIEPLQTMIQNLSFPNEHEIYLKEDEKIKILSIEKL